MNSDHNFQSITCLFLKVVEKRAVLSHSALELHWIIESSVQIFSITLIAASQFMVVVVIIT